MHGIMICARLRDTRIVAIDLRVAWEIFMWTMFIMFCMLRCVSLCIPDLWCQWKQGLFEFFGGPTNWFSQKPLITWRGLEVACHARCHANLPSTFIRPVRRWWKRHLWHCNCGELGFWKEYRPFWLLMKILQFNSCWSLKCHNSYRQVYEWVYSIYIVHSFMHRNLLLLLARWRPSVSILNCLKYKPLFTFWSCNNVEQLLWSTSATLFCLSGAGITRGWTACLQSGGPVLIGQTDIECSKLSGTIRKRLEIFTVHYQGGPSLMHLVQEHVFRIICGKLTWIQCKEVSTSRYLSL